jgi:transcriptional antiterminator NusG
MAKAWYVVHTYSGLEEKAVVSLQQRITKANMNEFFGEILIPSEEVTQTIKGEKKTKQKKFFPGYILVQMELNNETWQLVKNTSKITGFVGGSMNPPAISDEEVNNLTYRIKEGSLTTKSQISFNIGDQIRVVEGPFLNFNGVIEEVKPDKQKIRVLVSIFGRSTPVELDFNQVEHT